MVNNTKIIKSIILKHFIEISIILIAKHSLQIISIGTIHSPILIFKRNIRKCSTNIREAFRRKAHHLTIFSRKNKILLPIWFY